MIIVIIMIVVIIVARGWPRRARGTMPMPTSNDVGTTVDTSVSRVVIHHAASSACPIDADTYNFRT